MDNQQGEDFADVVRRAYPSAAVEHMRALANAGALVPTFQDALASLSANPEILKATMRAAEIQSRWSGQQVSEAITAVETLSRVLRVLPDEKRNLLATAIAEVAKPLLVEQSGTKVEGGGQSMPIPVTVVADVQRTVVRSEQITFALQRVVTNSALEPSAVDELKEWLLNTGDIVYDALRVRLPLLVPVFVAWANNLKADGRVDEYNAVMFLVIFSIVLINPRDK